LQTQCLPTSWKRDFLYLTEIFIFSSDFPYCAIRNGASFAHNATARSVRKPIRMWKFFGGLFLLTLEHGERSMAQPMTEYKRLTIAWGTVAAMLALVLGGSLATRPSALPKATDVDAANLNFQSKITQSTPSSMAAANQQEVLAYKPHVPPAPADESPSLPDPTEGWTSIDPAEDVTLSEATEVIAEPDEVEAVSESPLSSDSIETPSAEKPVPIAATTNPVEASPPVAETPLTKVAEESRADILPTSDSVDDSDIVVQVPVDVSLVDEATADAAVPESPPAADAMDDSSTGPQKITAVVEAESPSNIGATEEVANDAAIVVGEEVKPFAEEGVEQIVEATPPILDDNSHSLVAEESQTVVAELVETTKSSSKSQKPFFGVGIRGAGSIVTTLYVNSTAQKLGITLGDEIVAINGTSISDLARLRKALKSASVGMPTTVSVRRGSTNLELGPLPLGTK